MNNDYTDDEDKNINSGDSIVRAHELGSALFGQKLYSWAQGWVIQKIQWWNQSWMDFGTKSSEHQKILIILTMDLIPLVWLPSTKLFSEAKAK